jgi:ABC-type ATPase with predicted acetyltransferase domain
MILLLVLMGVYQKYKYIVTRLMNNTETTQHRVTNSVVHQAYRNTSMYVCMSILYVCWVKAISQPTVSWNSHFRVFNHCQNKTNYIYEYIAFNPYKLETLLEEDLIK